MCSIEDLLLFLDPKVETHILVSHNAQYDAYEVRIDTNLLYEFEVKPELNLASLHFGTVASRINTV